MIIENIMGKNDDENIPVVYSIGPFTLDTANGTVTMSPGIYCLQDPVTFGLIDATNIRNVKYHGTDKSGIDTYIAPLAPTVIIDAVRCTCLCHIRGDLTICPDCECVPAKSRSPLEGKKPFPF